MIFLFGFLLGLAILLVDGVDGVGVMLLIAFTAGGAGAQWIVSRELDRADKTIQVAMGFNPPRRRMKKAKDPQRSMQRNVNAQRRSVRAMTRNRRR